MMQIICIGKTIAKIKRRESIGKVLLISLNIIKNCPIIITDKFIIRKIVEYFILFSFFKRMKQPI